MSASDASAFSERRKAQASRKVADEAFTAAWTGQPLSTEIKSQGPTLLHQGEGEKNDGANAMPSGSLAVSETLRMSRNFLRGNREIQEVLDGEYPIWPGVEGHNPNEHHERFLEVGQECSTVDPSKTDQSRKGEGRLETSGNLYQGAMPETQCSDPMQLGLERVRQAAKKDKEMRFNNLLHHVNIHSLRSAYLHLSRSAVPGIDEVTWIEYGENLEVRLAHLCDRVHKGSYRAQASKRTWIPKSDGTKRPLGIACLEDKIVQQAVSVIMQAIYEVDFVKFSYGFRPGRSPENALDAVWVGIVQRKVNWILDADIKGFFDTIDHQWLMKFLGHRIADPRILGLIDNWLRAGVSEKGLWSSTSVGTPQGSVISPLLANIYLHYVLDLWVNWWRGKKERGEVIIVRFADDFVLGFQYENEANQFLHELRNRLEKFRLMLHPDKTRLIEFGRFAHRNRVKLGKGAPETFNFLGFTHRCDVSFSKGRFTVIRKTIAKRLGTVIQRIGEKLKMKRSLPIAEQGKWLGSVVRGWLNYHAIPGNSYSITSFMDRVTYAWRRALRRRSQRAAIGTQWKVMTALVDQYLPRAIIKKGYPNERLLV